MSKQFTLEQIREFWTNQAITEGQSPRVSWSDVSVIDMEIREILKFLADGDRVLDVGSATGYSTVQFAANKTISIRGLDYVPEMVEQARKRLEDLDVVLKGTAEFDVGDITQLNEPSDHYDKVVVVRVIINLKDWSRQELGLSECARVLKPGGLLLLSEATIQGWNQLNRFRNEWGLSDIPMPPFNQYLDQDRVVDAVSSQLELVEVLNFSSSYFVGTRVFKPLICKALGMEDKVADPDLQWNRWFSQMPAWGDYGVQKLFVLRKLSTLST